MKKITAVERVYPPSPRERVQALRAEIDTVIAKHIAEATAFGVPHSAIGQLLGEALGGTCRCSATVRLLTETATLN